MREDFGVGRVGLRAMVRIQPWAGTHANMARPSPWLPSPAVLSARMCNSSLDCGVECGLPGLPFLLYGPVVELRRKARRSAR